MQDTLNNDGPKNQLRLAEGMNKLNGTVDYGAIELANQQGCGFLYLPNNALQWSRRL
ncbi:MAG: hypothetical protein AB7K41_16650 [Bdellovibrionales bacterium]